ncbi:DUF3048 domain-containing protein, partial [Candidatus Peregrinibacteria bacterium]|nr:DUF3048 domain-containing protein [Candidatus Peregrinibacteria bacterium]
VLPWYKKEKSLFAVMIENHQIARLNHEGIEKAEMVHEYFVEGFISRFVALFDSRSIPKRIGPVRSLRPYFLQSIAPWTSVVFHAGGSPEALERVEDHNDFLNFNALYLEDDYFERDSNVSAPHDLFLSKKDTSKLLEQSDDYLVPVSWPIYETGRAAHGSGASTIDVNFFSTIHNITYTYNEFSRSYNRLNGNILSSAKPSNLIFLQMSTEEIGPFGRLKIDTIGRGDALFFRSGVIYKGIWSRNNERDSFTFSNLNGEPIIFATGQIWITSVDSLQKVSWED